MRSRDSLLRTWFTDMGVLRIIVDRTGWRDLCGAVDSREGCPGRLRLDCSTGTCEHPDIPSSRTSWTRGQCPAHELLSSTP